MNRLCCLLTATVALLGNLPAALAAQKLNLQRQDGISVKAKSYSPQGACRGIALVSPGAGGNEKGYDYLGDALSSQGYLAVVIGHPESSRREVRRHSRGQSTSEGLEELITEPEAYQGRYQDIDVYRHWAQARCPASQSLLVGHSMGAITTLMQAGARNQMGMPPTEPFSAYIALSPQGSGLIFPPNAWSAISRPVLMITGTRDGDLGGASWQTRTEPFQNMPEGCKWLAVIEGATHLNFAGKGISRKVETLTTRTMGAFLEGLKRGDCRYGTPTQGITVQTK